jgi:hypothetical protein
MVSILCWAPAHQEFFTQQQVELQGNRPPISHPEAVELPGHSVQSPAFKCVFACVCCRCLCVPAACARWLT